MNINLFLILLNIIIIEVYCYKSSSDVLNGAKKTVPLYPGTLSKDKRINVMGKSFRKGADNSRISNGYLSKYKLKSDSISGNKLIKREITVTEPLDHLTQMLPKNMTQRSLFTKIIDIVKNSNTTVARKLSPSKETLPNTTMKLFNKFYKDCALKRLIIKEPRTGTSERIARTDVKFPDTLIDNDRSLKMITKLDHLNNKNYEMSRRVSNNESGSTNSDSSLHMVITFLMGTLDRIIKQHEDLKRIHNDLSKLTNDMLRKDDRVGFDACLIEQQKLLNNFESKIIKKQEDIIESSKSTKEMKEKLNKMHNVFIQQHQLFNDLQMKIKNDTDNLTNKQTEVNKKQDELIKKVLNIIKMLQRKKKSAVKTPYDNSNRTVVTERSLDVTTLSDKAKNELLNASTINFNFDKINVEPIKRINLLEIPNTKLTRRNFEGDLLKIKEHRDIDDVVYKYYFENAPIIDILKPMLSTEFNRGGNNDLYEKLKTKRDNVNIDLRNDKTILKPAERTKLKPSNKTMSYAARKSAYKSIVSALTDLDDMPRKKRHTNATTTTSATSSASALLTAPLPIVWPTIASYQTTIPSHQTVMPSHQTVMPSHQTTMMNITNTISITNNETTLNSTTNSNHTQNLITYNCVIVGTITLDLTSAMCTNSTGHPSILPFNITLLNITSTTSEPIANNETTVINDYDNKTIAIENTTVSKTIDSLHIDSLNAAENTSYISRNDIVNTTPSYVYNDTIMSYLNVTPTIIKPMRRPKIVRPFSTQLDMHNASHPLKIHKKSKKTKKREIVNRIQKEGSILKRSTGDKRKSEKVSGHDLKRSVEKFDKSNEINNEREIIENHLVRYGVTLEKKPQDKENYNALLLLAKNYCVDIGQNSNERSYTWCIKKELKRLRQKYQNGITDVVSTITPKSKNNTTKSYNDSVKTVKSTITQKGTTRENEISTNFQTTRATTVIETESPISTQDDERDTVTTTEAAISVTTNDIPDATESNEAYDDNVDDETKNDTNKEKDDSLQESEKSSVTDVFHSNVVDIPESTINIVDDGIELTPTSAPGSSSSFDDIGENVTELSTALDDIDDDGKADDINDDTDANDDKDSNERDEDSESN